MTSPRVGATATSKAKADVCRASFSVSYPLKKAIKEALLAGWRKAWCRIISHGAHVSEMIQELLEASRSFPKYTCWIRYFQNCWRNRSFYSKTCSRCILWSAAMRLSRKDFSNALICVFQLSLEGKRLFFSEQTDRLGFTDKRCGLQVLFDFSIVFGKQTVT